MREGERGGGGEGGSGGGKRMGERDETCPVSTEGWTRSVHFVREGGGGRRLQRAVRRWGAVGGSGRRRLSERDAVHLADRVLDLEDFPHEVQPPGRVRLVRGESARARAPPWAQRGASRLAAGAGGAPVLLVVGNRPKVPHGFNAWGQRVEEPDLGHGRVCHRRAVRGREIHAGRPRCAPRSVRCRVRGACSVA